MLGIETKPKPTGHWLSAQSDTKPTESEYLGTGADSRLTGHDYLSFAAR